MHTTLDSIVVYRILTSYQFSRTSVPLRQDPKNVPNAHEFKHCYQYDFLS
jgi:hypothetical protein